MAMKANQPVELTQALQTIKWLDEERRKDKATIAVLQERLQSQEQSITQQANQIQDLRAALSEIQGVLSRVAEFEQMVSNYKAELLFQVDQRDEARRKEIAEAERLRRIEYEALITNLNRLEGELHVLPKYAESITGVQTEQRRLNELMQQLDVTVMDLSKRVEERMKVVVYLEEQRRADNRRITELEQDLPELRGSLDPLNKKLLLLEDAIQKQRARIEVAIEETKKYEQPIEELRVSDFQREQKMRQYLDQGAQVAQELERLRSQTQGFIEQQQEVKRSLAALEKFKVRIERRQDEMVEQQRLLNEQIERRWTEWQAEQSKNQKKRDVIAEEKWRQQEQVDTNFEKQIETLQQITELHHDQIAAMWGSLRADAVSFLKAAQDIYETLVAPIDPQLNILHGRSQKD